MKKCLKCGTDNKNENAFCSICGGSSFAEPYSDDNVYAQPQLQQQADIIPPYPANLIPERKPFGVFDVLTILGFVSSLVGLWCIWIALEPIAVISSILGFFKGTRSKGLAAAGFVIAVIAFIIRLFMALYDNNVIGKWAVDGIVFR